jgi:WD40 repeat protein
MSNPSPNQLLQLQTKVQLQDYITALAWLPGAKGADLAWAIASAAGEVAVWQHQTLQQYRAAQAIGIDCLGYSADGRFLAAGGRNGHLSVWDNGQPVAVPPVGKGWIDRLAWHPQQPLLAFSCDRQLHLWDAQQQTLTSLVLPHAIFDLAWQPQGEFLATAGYRGLSVRSLADWETAELLAVDTGAHRLAWSRDGQYVAAATLDRMLTIARTDALEQPWVMSGFAGKIQDLAWLNGEPLLAVLSDRQLIYWFYAEAEWQALAEPECAAALIAAHPTEPLVARASVGGSLDLQELDFAVLASQPLADCTLLAWHPEGQFLLTGDANGAVICWKLAEPKAIEQ